MEEGEDPDAATRIEREAEKLASLEMEAAVGWPEGGGWQTTAEEHEGEVRSNLMGPFVTENKHRIISICTIRAKPGQKVHAFISYLNCHPDYYGKKKGKFVLWAAMDRANEAGFQRVDLGTWPGALKAVYLYKKMRFMWRPDTSVHMEKFTPAARRHPLGAAFFARDDWYETHMRELKLEEDVMMRGKVRVYEYLWRAPDGDFLRMVFDRQSWGMIEIENNDLMVSCSLPDAFGVVLRLRTWSVLRPGVMLDRRIALGQGPLVRVVDTVINGSALPLDRSLILGWGMRIGPRTAFVVPRKQGVHRQTAGSGGHDLGDLRASRRGGGVAGGMDLRRERGWLPRRCPLGESRAGRPGPLGQCAAGGGTAEAGRVEDAGPDLHFCRGWELADGPGLVADAVRRRRSGG